MHRRMMSGAVVLVLAGALLLAACSSGESGHLTASSAAAASSDRITISNFMYSPMTDDVAPGATISVMNIDTVTHTLTATGGGQFNTGDIAPHQTKTFKAPIDARHVPLHL